jgi:Amt family ammonium transporter
MNSWLSLVLAAMAGLVGVGLFFASLVRVKNTIATLGQVLLVVCVSVLVWVGVQSVLTQPGSGLSLIFGNEAQWLPTVQERSALSMSLLISVAGLVVGAVAERMRRVAMVVIALLWTLLLFTPITLLHWYSLAPASVWMFLDWGGASVHVAMGSFAVGLAFATGSRRGYGRMPMPPYDLGRAVVGGLVLTIGYWVFAEFGATSALQGVRSGALNAAVAGMAGLLAWALAEHIHRGVSSTLGMVSGALCATVAVSAIAGWCSPLGALLVGGAGSLVGFFGAVVVRRWHSVDDTLDIFAIHGTPAFFGLLVAPLFVEHPKIAWLWQSIAAFLIGLISFGVGVLIATGLRRLGILRVSFDEEDVGLDITHHGETVHPPQSSL